MPFTFTHPAAIIPVFKWARRKDLLLPLAIGSMMPDFGYYFAPVELFNENAHTLLKSFTFCLPVGLFTLIIILVLRSGFLSLLPNNKSRTFFYDHLPEKLTLKFIALASIAIQIGTRAHILWDAFTHKNGFLVGMFPFLQFELFSGVQVFRLLQHISTLVGAYFLFRFYRQFPVAPGAYDRQSLRYIIVANFISLSSALSIRPFQWFFFITGFFKTFILISFAIAFTLTLFRRVRKN
jgi:hypothetical protein